MANGKFNRGSSESGRQRDGSRLPGQSAGEGNVGNVIPRPTTTASIRRQQALMRILSDKLPGGSDFSRGTTKGGVRRNFAMMANMSLAGASGVQLVRAGVSAPGVSILWDSENYDYENWWTTGSTLTCPANGTYDIAYSLAVTHSIGGVTMDIYVNGASVDSQFFALGTSPIAKTASIALTAGDTIYLQFSANILTTVDAGTITIT